MQKVYNEQLFNYDSKSIITTQCKARYLLNNLTLPQLFTSLTLSATGEERGQRILFGFFSTASLLDLDGCGDVSYLLVDQLEKRVKRHMQGARGREDEN